MHNLQTIQTTYRMFKQHLGLTAKPSKDGKKHEKISLVI